MAFVYENVFDCTSCRKRRRKLTQEKIHESVVPCTVTTHRVPAEFRVTARDTSEANSKLHVLNEQNLHDVGSASEASPRHSLRVLAMQGRKGRLSKQTKQQTSLHKQSNRHRSINKTTDIAPQTKQQTSLHKQNNRHRSINKITDIAPQTKQQTSLHKQNPPAVHKSAFTRFGSVSMGGN